jgi:hypothetical protein
MRDLRGDTLSEPGKRPWFGPKRIGYGLRPQTWQGWTIVLVLAAAAIGAGFLLH